MRRILLTLVGLGMFLCGTNVAMAHGPHYGYRHPVARHAYYPGYPRWGVGYAPGYAAGYAPGYTPGCGVGYGGGYGGAAYGYPQAGIGFAGRNFSLWYGQ